MRYHEVRRLLWGVIGAVDSKTKERRLFDAHHVATAVWYRCDGFITTDNKLIERSSALRDKWPNYFVGSPSDAERLIGQGAASYGCATLSHVPYADGLDWLPDRVTLVRADLVELLPALRALVDAVDTDTAAYAHVITVAKVLARALDREDEGGANED